MELRIKEICKEKGILQKDLADKMGIAQESLTRAINKNPQLSTLEKIANALEVDITELFPKPTAKVVTGFLEIDNKIYKINNLNDLKSFTLEVENR